MALGIESLTIGFSQEGLEEYKNNLKAQVITTTEEKINDISKIISALDAGWEGMAKDTFVQQFSEARTKIISDLNSEYADLEARFAQLANDYFTQDREMMNS